MVQPIHSREIFGNVSMTRGPAPKHTTEGHEQCAYYVDQDHGYVVCPHGEKAVDGAFYTEDMVQPLKELAHFLINLHDLEQQKPDKIEALRRLTV